MTHPKKVYLVPQIHQGGSSGMPYVPATVSFWLEKNIADPFSLFSAPEIVIFWTVSGARNTGRL